MAKKKDKKTYDSNVPITGCNKSFYDTNDRIAGKKREWLKRITDNRGKK